MPDSRKGMMTMLTIAMNEQLSVTMHIPSARLG